MNKILILLSLIYLISCKLACSSEEKDPENEQECYERAVDDEDNGVCCFIKVKGLELLDTVNKCAEFDNKINKDFIKQSLISQYSNNNYTLENFSCPIYEKNNNDSSQEDDTSSNICDCAMDEKNYKNCFSKTVEDNKNNFCCYVSFSIKGATQGGCSELQKSKALDDLKQELNNDVKSNGLTVEKIECPPIEQEEKDEKKEENSSQGNTSNKGFYIKSGLVLIIAFLF